MRDDDMERVLGRIEGKLDLMLDTQKNHGTRLDVLDEIKNKGYGIVTAITIGAGTIGATMSKAIAALFHSPQS